MKQRNSIYQTAVAVLALLFAAIPSVMAVNRGETTGQAEQNDSQPHPMDSISISLLTVGPGNEVWSLYGHTALRYQDHLRHTDIAINYGAFSFDQDYFVPRFVFGLTDYEMAMLPMNLFLEAYKQEHRWVLQQHLDLTKEEKQRIVDALYQNSLPQNRVYRYNYFYDNCTTRARDMLLDHLNKDIQLSGNEELAPTYREMTHQWNENHRWMRFGNDLLLGIKADFKTDFAAREFLPDSLRKDFDHLYLLDETTEVTADGDIATTSGSKRKLVDTCFYLIPPQAEAKNPTAELTHADLLTPEKVFGALLVVVIILTAACQWRLKRNLWQLDLMLLLVTGLCGLVLLAMVFSQHPTVQVNLQLLLLNPLSLVFLYPTIKAERKRRAYWYWKLLLVCLILFLLGGFVQDYAEGMEYLALCLLVRCWFNLRM